MAAVLRFRCSVRSAGPAAHAGVLGAAAQGQAAPDVHVVPVLSEMGDGTPLGITTALLTVVSAACLAFSCHFNILPIVSSGALHGGWGRAWGASRA